jgi:peptide/nickel transport system permease protein
MHVVKRIGAGLLMIYVVTTLVFFLIRLMPGSPYQLMVNELIQQGYSMTAAENQVHILLGFEPKGPVLSQYWQFIGNLVHGNLGTSVSLTGQPVLRLIAEAAPWTILVVATSLLLSFGFGIVVGTLAAYFRGTWIDQVIANLSAVLNGVPQFITAIVLFYFLATLGHLFPIGGAYSPSVAPGFSFAFIVSVADHAVLPILSFVLSIWAGWALSMKASTISILGEDFVTAAKAMAINPRVILASYVGKNSILPLFTGLVLSLGFMFGGSIFVEQIFNYPGLGYLFVNGTASRDFPLMQGCFLLLTTAVIFANIAADLLYHRLDPRIRG